MKYNKQTGITSKHLSKIATGNLTVTFSAHALESAKNDRYGKINLCKWVKVSLDNVIEYEVENDKITKVLYRFSYDNNHDVVIVLIPERMFVKTVWMNDKQDTHETLKKENYVIL